MKKYIVFITLLLFLFLSYLYIYNKPRDYSLEYNYSNYKVIEEYHKDKAYYSFNIENNGVNYYFIINSKYTSKRKLIDSIVQDDETKCLSMVVHKKKSYSLCYDSGEYYLDYQVNEGAKEDYNNYEIYNKNYNYYVWNNFGIKDVITNKEYRFIKNETYDNRLNYVLKDYILFADYDTPREFSKFYLFNHKKKIVEEIIAPQKISANSYYLGDYKDSIYFFDKKNKIEYEINIKNKKINIVSDKNGGIIFDGEWTHTPLTNLTYNNVLFNKNKLYTYKLEADKLYLNINGFNKDIFIASHVSSIIYQNDYEVFYLVNNTVYSFNISTGINKLISNFEWNFNYQNKIFIFN